MSIMAWYVAVAFLGAGFAGGIAAGVIWGRGRVYYDRLRQQERERP